jgi:pimeloyl-ACP methyl ester carboxylesterase
MRTRTFYTLKTAIPTLLLLLYSLPVVAGAQVMPPPMPPEKAVQVYGQNIHYYEAGRGANLVFIHGLGGEASHWALNIGPVAHSYHVYALDQIGFGKSDKPFIEYKIETFVDFLKEFMRVLDIPTATLVGNSLGGWIAADFAARYPGQVDMLVLVDAAGLEPQASERLAIDLNPASLEGMRQILQHVVYNQQLVTDQMVRQAYEHRLRSGDGYTIQRLLAGRSITNQWEDAKLASIHAPTLVVWGHDDKLVPLSIGERYQKGIAGAKLVVLEQCGHTPQLEKPAEFNKALLDFLAHP